ncbi:WG repeat-containing protein [Phyllobacterium endophyticum]|nr:WG repeat-containing protein [Phyllobacterium endophyticum]
MFGYINPDGDWVIQLQFARVRNFQDDDRAQPLQA